MKVVLLELDRGSQRIAVAALRYGGYEVTTAHTVEQVITQTRTHRSDAILADLKEGGAGCGPLFAADDRWFLVDVIPMHDDGGAIARWIGSGTDGDISGAGFPAFLLGGIIHLPCIHAC